MSRVRAEAKIRKIFEHAMIKYHITEAPEDIKKNLESLPKYQEVLEKAGIHLIIRDDTLMMYLDPEAYTRNQTRYAGCLKQPVINPDAPSKTFDNILQYSDIIYMLQTMNDIEIMEKIQMPRATYYRHKKIMFDSNYWRMIDKKKLLDKTYLDEQPYNLKF